MTGLSLVQQPRLKLPVTLRFPDVFSVLEDPKFLRFWTIIYVKTIESIKKMGYNETKKQRNFSAPFSGG